MKLLTKLRNLGGYENMSWQQLESLFTTPSAFASTPKPENNCFKTRKEHPQPQSKSNTEA